MKVVIKCVAAKAMWDDLILSHEGPSKTRDTKMAAVRLKFNAFKALKGEKDSDSVVEEDTRSSIELLSDLNLEFHDRALLANQKRIYKRLGRVGVARKPIDKSNEPCIACGKLRHFQKECPTTKTSPSSHPSSNKTHNKTKFHTNSPSSSHKHNQTVDNGKKDYKVRYKALKAKLALLTQKIEVVSTQKSEKGLVAESFD
nr:hypothetical protein [Tanacetum cinerariifolium]